MSQRVENNPTRANPDCHHCWKHVIKRIGSIEYYKCCHCYGPLQKQNTTWLMTDIITSRYLATSRAFNKQVNLERISRDGKAMVR